MVAKMRLNLLEPRAAPLQLRSGRVPQPMDAHLRPRQPSWLVSTGEASPDEKRGESERRGKDCSEQQHHDEQDDRQGERDREHGHQQEWSCEPLEARPADRSGVRNRAAGHAYDNAGSTPQNAFWERVSLYQRTSMR
jgi:hypothetical protein